MSVHYGVKTLHWIIWVALYHIGCPPLLSLKIDYYRDYEEVKFSIINVVCHCADGIMWFIEGNCLFGKFLISTIA